MRPRIGFHPDRARRQRHDQFVQLGARHVWPHRLRFAGGVYPTDGKHVFGEIDADDYGAPHPLEISISFVVMNSSNAGWPRWVASIPRLSAATMSAGSVTRSPYPPKARAISA